jgi:hypothetical protein
MVSLDPELQLLLVRKQFFDRNASLGTLEVAPDELLYISVRFRGDIAALQEIGLKVATTVGHIAYGVYESDPA